MELTSKPEIKTMQPSESEQLIEGKEKKLRN
jgi:hypothetical protein